jgi:hypothetical protein
MKSTTSATIATSKDNLWAILSNWARMHNKARISWSMRTGFVSVDITAPKAYREAALLALTKLVA